MPSSSLFSIPSKLSEIPNPSNATHQPLTHHASHHPRNPRSHLPPQNKFHVFSLPPPPPPNPGLLPRPPPRAILPLPPPPRPARILLKSRHVFITGGSSGIGLSPARQSASQGAALSLLVRSRPKLDSARESICLATGVDARVFSADVRDAEAVSRAVEEAGPIDVLICNQGVFTPQELELQSLEEVKFMMEVKVMGTFNLIKAALPGMKRRVKESGVAGSIAIMSSQAGQVGVYGYTAYSASKFALRGLAEALQHEVIGDNIHITLIFPPDTETPRFVEEHKMRPEITNLIAGSSVGMKADDVAAKALNGIKAGAFIVPCKFEGTMLSIATAGLSPQPLSLTAFVEVFGSGFMRFMGLCFQWNWFSIIDNYHAKKHNTGVSVNEIPGMYPICSFGFIKKNREDLVARFRMQALVSTTLPTFSERKQVMQRD